MRRCSALECCGGLLGAMPRSAAPARSPQADTHPRRLRRWTAGMDPALAVVGASHQAIDLIYSGLTKLDNDAEPDPRPRQVLDDQRRRPARCSPSSFVPG